jgi:hypothetical protein
MPVSSPLTLLLIPGKLSGAGFCEPAEISSYDIT